MSAAAEGVAEGYSGEVAARSMAMVAIAISVVAAAGGWNGSRGGCTEGKFEVKGERGSG